MVTNSQDVLAMCTAWSMTSPSLRPTGGSDSAARKARHRDAVVTSVAALVEALRDDLHVP